MRDKHHHTTEEKHMRPLRFGLLVLALAAMPMQASAEPAPQASTEVFAPDVGPPAVSSFDLTVIDIEQREVISISVPLTELPSFPADVQIAILTQLQKQLDHRGPITRIRMWRVSDDLYFNDSGSTALGAIKPAYSRRV
jgi:hypothetical protein